MTLRFELLCVLPLVNSLRQAQGERLGGQLPNRLALSLSKGFLGSGDSKEGDVASIKYVSDPDYWGASTNVVQS